MVFAAAIHPEDLELPLHQASLGLHNASLPFFSRFADGSDTVLDQPYSPSYTDGSDVVAVPVTIMVPRSALGGSKLAGWQGGSHLYGANLIPASMPVAENANIYDDGPGAFLAGPRGYRTYSPAAFAVENTMPVSQLAAYSKHAWPYADENQYQLMVLPRSTKLPQDSALRGFLGSPEVSENSPEGGAFARDDDNMREDQYVEQSPHARMAQAQAEDREDRWLDQDEARNAQAQMSQPQAEDTGASQRCGASQPTQMDGDRASASTGDAFQSHSSSIVESSRFSNLGGRPQLLETSTECKDGDCSRVERHVGLDRDPQASQHPQNAGVGAHSAQSAVANRGFGSYSGLRDSARGAIDKASSWFSASQGAIGRSAPSSSQDEAEDAPPEEEFQGPGGLPLGLFRKEDAAPVANEMPLRATLVMEETTTICKHGHCHQVKRFIGPQGGAGTPVGAPFGGLQLLNLPPSMHIRPAELTGIGGPDDPRTSGMMNGWPALSNRGQRAPRGHFLGQNEAKW